MTVARIKNPRHKIMPLFIKCLMAEGGSTIAQLAELTEWHPSTARSFVNAFHAAGMLHIAGFTRRVGKVPGRIKYLWGPGVDAVRAKSSKPDAVRQRACKKAVRERRAEFKDPAAKLLQKTLTKWVVLDEATV